jgi:hypothetical protein
MFSLFSSASHPSTLTCQLFSWQILSCCSPLPDVKRSQVYPSRRDLQLPTHYCLEYEENKARKEIMGWLWNIRVKCDGTRPINIPSTITLGLVIGRVLWWSTTPNISLIRIKCLNSFAYLDVWNDEFLWQSRKQLVTTPVTIFTFSGT